MKVNPMDDGCTNRSPCHGCGLHKQGIDKLLCFAKCERLAAYRSRGEWEGVPEMSLKKVNDVSKNKHEIEEMDEIKPVKRQKDLNCLIDGCDKPAYSRGLCVSCLGKWRYGSIVHPLEGVFTPKYKPSQKVKTQPEHIKKKRPLRTISLPLENYPQIRDALIKMSKKSTLPIQHIIMGLLSETLYLKGKE